MAQVNLNCPHCDGAFSLSDVPLRSATWTCPYCGKESLLQRNEDGISIRAILHDSTGINRKDDARLTVSSDLNQIVSKQPDSNDWTSPDARSLSDYLAEIDQLESPESDTKKEQVARQASNDSSYEQLLQQAENAVRQGSLHLFNSFSRQILDQKPYEYRVYAWRARLIEEADGFARNIWATPIWYLYTPRQKEARLRQHFYALNTALQFSDSQTQKDLCTTIGRLLVRQAIDHLTEKAELRCARRWFGKTFKGRYHKSDLKEAADFCDAVARIDQTVCPDGYESIKQSIRNSAGQLQRRLARALSRF